MTSSAGHTIVRAALPHDAAEVQRLLDQLRAPGSPPHGPVDLEPFLGSPDWMLLVAELDGAVCGITLIGRRRRLGYVAPETWLSAMVVDEAARGGGIGTALLRAAEDQATVWGCRSIRLESRGHRRGAHAFYAASGYAPHGVSFEKVLDSPPGNGAR